MDKFFQEHEDEIREEIYDRNDSDTLKELLKNTDDIPVRVEMLSNYDCINSNWLESQEGYRYKESYFGDMIDALNLNPAKVKKMLVEKGYTVYGRFPDKKPENRQQLRDQSQEPVTWCLAPCPAASDWHARPAVGNSCLSHRAATHS